MRWLIPFILSMLAVGSTSAATQTATVINGGNFRSAPVVSASNVLGQVCPQDTVSVLEQQGVWYRVQVDAVQQKCVPNRVAVGARGWLNGSLLRINASSTQPVTVSSPSAVPGQEFSGRGAKVLSLEVPELSKIYLGHEGRANFIVRSYSADGDDELLVNAIGYYAGIRLITSGFYELEIDADGPWLVRVIPVTVDSSARGAFSGRGDDIRGVFAPSKTRAAYRFAHQGQGNFIVHLICDSHSDLLANEIGPFNGEAIVVFNDAQACLWDITADGAWSIAPK